MRRNNGQFAKGESGNPAGRPKRADEQFLVDLWNSTGRIKFAQAVGDGEQWALKKLVDKVYPNMKAEAYLVESSNPEPILSRITEIRVVKPE